MPKVSKIGIIAARREREGSLWRMVRKYLFNEVKIKKVVNSVLAYVLYYLSFCNQST